MMNVITFNSHIAKGIFTESRFYAKHHKWPYLDYEKGGRSLYSGNNSFVECGYSFPHNITSVYWITGKISYKHLYCCPVNFEKAHFMYPHPRLNGDVDIIFEK